MTAGFGRINCDHPKNAAQRPGEAPVMVYQSGTVRRLRLCRRNPAVYRKNLPDFEGAATGAARRVHDHSACFRFLRLNGIDMDMVAQENMAPPGRSRCWIRGDIDVRLCCHHSQSWFNLIRNRQDPEKGL